MKKINKNKPNCIIAARGNSKRLKNKNILTIDGKSLIEIVINKAKKSNLFDQIIVSTDSKKIANIAKKSGALVPFLRSKKLSNDSVGILPVVKDTVLQTNSKYKKFNFFIYPTAILLKISDLKKSYQKFIKTNCNFLVAIKKTQSHPLRCFEIRNQKYLKYKWPQNKNKRGQDLKNYYNDAGSYFIFNTKNFLKFGFNEKNNSFFVLDQFSCVDINNQDDFNLAKLFYKQKNKK